jgi:hypothetical protein
VVKNESPTSIKACRLKYCPVQHMFLIGRAKAVQTSAREAVRTPLGPADCGRGLDPLESSSGIFIMFFSEQTFRHGYVYFKTAARNGGLLR